MKTMKRILASLLAILLTVTMMPLSVLATGTQTTTDAELDAQGWIGISTPEEFLAIKDDNDAKYYLENDIDFTDYNGTGAYKVEYLVKEFNGTLDGREKTLKGFELYSNIAQPYVGVFDSIATTRPTTIKNIKIGTNTEGGAITANIADATTNAYFGFIAARAGGSANVAKIDNVTVYGNCTVTGTYTNKGHFLRIGGIVGWARDISITNSSFTGSIQASGAGSAGKAVRLCVGGLIGDADTWSGGNTVFVQNCTVNNATLVANRTTGSLNLEYVGGFIGFCETIFAFVENSSAGGTYTSSSYVGGAVGCIETVRTTNSASAYKAISFVADGCTSNATLTGATKGDVWGGSVATNGAPIIYVKNCSGDQNTEALNIGEIPSEGFDNTQNYVWVIDSASDFDLIGTTDTTVTDYTYPLNGIYRLNGANGVIDMGTDAYDSNVVTDTFSGILDGNDNTLTNLNLTSNGTQTGFFKQLGTSGDRNAIIMDLTIGTKNKPAEVITKAQDTGVLTGIAYNTLVRGVDVYAKINNTCVADSALNQGGFIGRLYNGTYLDCNMFGSIAVSAQRPHRTNMGGLLGIIDANGFIRFENCNNFAEISATCSNTGTKSDWVFLGGLVGVTWARVSVLHCNNIGNVFNNSESKNEDTGGVCAGGLIGTNNDKAPVFVDCTNFGHVTAQGTTANGTVSAGAFSAYGTAAVTVTLYECDNYGTVTGTISSNITLNRIDGNDGKAIDMKDGASVRLSSDTGLRFQGTVSTDAIAKLEEIFGEDTLSYGMLISPDLFVQNAGGFTHALLDAYATKENGFADGEKAYVDVAATDWFKGEEGVVAGSITGLPATLYKTNFSGVAYIKVTVGGVEICTLYAADPQSRTIYYVAERALDDTYSAITTDSYGTVYDEQLEVGETYYVDEAKTTVKEGDVVYSCYTKTQRDTLNGIISAYDQLSAN